MLVLTRKKGEAIAIGDDIQVQVLSVKGGQVRIGVQAPKHVRINREERLRKNGSGRDAGSGSGGAAADAPAARAENG